MTKGIFAATLDPFTNGHLYIVEVASGIFDTLYICIATNPAKKERTFRKEGMKKAIEQTLKEKHIINCEVVCYDGEIIDLAKEVGAKYVVRGMRSSKEFDYEEKVATQYYKGGLETIYVSSGSYVGDGILSRTSSSLVRDLIKNNKNISKYVPKPIEQFIFENKK